MVRIVFLSEKNRARYLRVITPITKVLSRLGVHPNILSLAGLIFSLAAGFAFSTGAFFWGAWIVILAGTCDVMDGEIARRGGKSSRFGAFFDSTLDRYSDAFILLGMGWYFAGGPVLFGVEGGEEIGAQSWWAVVFVIAALAGSFMVSYTRARAETLGFECKIGLMQRPERITLLVMGSLLGSIPVVGLGLLKATLFILAVSSHITTIHRMIHVRSQFLGEKQDP
jgi:CDP-diacylglycerol--glycerol-3-phosphate 3-phosphatidyltransferase